jgi:hypothetical protein
MSDQYVGNLRQLKAIGLDVGNKDPNVAIGAQLLDRVLTTYGIAHPFENSKSTTATTSITSPNRIETNGAPFFSRNLSFEQHHQ